MLFRRSLIGRSQSAGKQSYPDGVLRGGLPALEVELTFRSKPPYWRLSFANADRLISGQAVFCGEFGDCAFKPLQSRIDFIAQLLS